MHKVKFEVQIQYYGGEIELDEEIEYEYDTLEEAEKTANEDCEGWRGTYVRVYLDNKYYRDYEN